MSVTVNLLTPRPISIGATYMSVADVTLDNPFDQDGNGEPLTAKQLGFSPQALDDPAWNVIVTATGGYVFGYDHANQKLFGYMQTDSDNNLPLGNVVSVSLSSLTVRVTAFSKFA